MRILVTGGAGFIGSHIVDAYVADGHEVTVVDDLSKGSLENLHPSARFVAMDLRDPELDAVFSAGRFDAVNHHAAQIDVRRSVEDPAADASVNILGTLGLLERCKAHGVRRFLFASSGGAVYGECRTGGAAESDPPRPESPYAASKAAAEHYVRIYGALHRIPYVILRYANVYGPRQDPRGEAGVITLFIDRMLAGKPATIYGTGEQSRDYVHVGDVVQANRAALVRGSNLTVNIGTGEATSVEALHGMLSGLAGVDGGPVRAPRRPGEIEHSVLNPARARETLGWRPLRSLEQGLAETFHFFQGRQAAAVEA